MLKPHRHVVSMALCAAALALSNTPSLAQARKAAISSASEALIVAYETTKDGKERLSYPVRSGVKLARTLKSLNYNVSFITDQGAHDRHQLNMKRDGVTVELINDSQTLNAWIGKWAYRRDAPVPRLTLVVLVGHGVVREGQPYFLTPGDTASDGGLRIGDLGRVLVSNGLNAVLVVDACRNDELKTSRPDAEFSGRMPTLLWSASSRQIALDQRRDFVASLARGLERTARGANEFVGTSAISHFYPPRFDKSVIRLGQLYHYAHNHVFAATNCKQSPTFRRGAVEWDTEVAALGRDARPALVNLLDKWTPARNGAIQASPLDRGVWRFVRPGSPGSASTAADYKGGTFGAISDGNANTELTFDVVNRGLEIEYVTEPADTENQKAGGKLPRGGVMPKGNPLTDLTKNGAFAFNGAEKVDDSGENFIFQASVPMGNPGQVYVAKLPFRRSDRRLGAVAVGADAWPVGYSVTLLGMHLVEQKDFPRGVTRDLQTFQAGDKLGYLTLRADVDLLPLWMARAENEGTRYSLHPSGFTDEPLDAKSARATTARGLTLTHENEAAQPRIDKLPTAVCNGELRSLVYVTSANEIKARLVAAPRQRGVVDIDIHYVGGHQVSHTQATFDGAQQTKDVRIEIEQSGLIEFLEISSDLPSVNIEYARVLLKKPR